MIFFQSKMRTLFCLALVALAIFSPSGLRAATTVKMMKAAGGVYLMPCTVNGLPLSFIIDTGASDVMISLPKAMFMAENGYLSLDDIVGTKKYRIANGEIDEGTVIILRELVIGDTTLKNVRGSISHSRKAPLLLGQSALSRLGTVYFDYAAGTVTFDNDASAGEALANLGPGDTQHRFSRTADGVITDSETNLQWLPGPDRDTNYDQAEQWIAAQTVAGGNWRMPTTEELKALRNESLAKSYNISPLFGATYYRWVWAGARDALSAWPFNFENGYENWLRRDTSSNGRVFAVRPRR